MAVYRLKEMNDRDRKRMMARAAAAVFDPALNESVREIVEDVRANGDEAVCRALRRFDSVECRPEDLRVSHADVATARKRVSADVLAGIRQGISNIRAFNERVLQGASWREEISPGLEVGEQARAIDSAGLFVPSGKGSFPSVLMHIGTPAVVAGVRRCEVVVPPTRGRGIEVDPAVLVVADELGLTEIFRVNGPAGVAALAFGTERIPKVGRVVGPGSPAVAAAQVQVQAFGCSTVMLFGPSESLTIADESADARVLAADVLNEAEHGLDSAAILVTDDGALVAALQTEIAGQLAELPEWRRSYAASAISQFGGAILVSDLDEAVAFANAYAPEHLLIATRDPEAIAAKVDNAGEILLGDTPFAAANFALGVPATLPTGGFAKYSSGVTARTFTKTTSVARTSSDALAQLAPGILALAEHEAFPGHAAAIRVRGLG
jgi:histidinol dehydrogenase